MTDLLLPGCTVPAKGRVPDGLVAECLTKLVDETLDDWIRAIQIEAAVIRSGAAESAVAWLITTPSSYLEGLTRVAASCRARPNAARLSRSDHVVGTCYVLGTKGIPDELRRRAAVRLISLCHEAGYAEARRLLPRNGWSWLIDALRDGFWAGNLALEFIGDAAAPLKTRIAVAVEYVESAPTMVFPIAVDELIRSAKAPSSERLRLATALAIRIPSEGLGFLQELASDQTLQPLHRVQAAEQLFRVDLESGREVLAMLAEDRRLSPSARELARRSFNASAVR
ncbi:hypothetical protein ACFY05_34270 [Microtetraspora fusca]|uniref:HEAT repeat domain-containing protein n=1 Tax=Microtetraspora fusca TaxID=1997 RepID=A0ABW6VEV7_MICFU